MKSRRPNHSPGPCCGITLLQLSCGDASADGGKKAKDTDKKAPAQPTKLVKKNRR